MPSRKTAPASSRSKSRASARQNSPVRGAAKGASPSTRRAKNSTRARAADKRTAKGSARRSAATSARPSGRKRVAAPREELRDVTAEVQRRYDIEDDDVPTPPSSLNLDRHASAARTGREQMNERRRQRNAASPEITAGDVDADWQGAYFVGDEAAAADNPTPGQSNGDAVGRAVGEEYQDTEELKFTDKVAKRDRHRWELDPASSEDYKERIETTRKRKAKG